MLFFGQKSDEESVEQAGGRTLLYVQLWYLFSSYKLPKTVIVTTLLFLGSVMLLCGTFLCINLSERPVLLSD